MLSHEDYKTYCRTMSTVWTYLRSVSLPEEEVIGEICRLRGYDEERMYGSLRKVGFLFMGDKFSDGMLGSLPSYYGLVSQKTGRFILKDRYIFPVKDMLGNIVAMIGWYPDEKKYVTTSSRLFSKECMFFGLEQLRETGLRSEYVVVEGIFDSISVRSLGIPCVAQMGISGSRYKEVLYGLFKRVLAIPDADVRGRQVLESDGWRIPDDSSYLKWSGLRGVKDIDDLIKMFSEEDMRELFNDAMKSKDRIINVEFK